MLRLLVSSLPIAEKTKCRVLGHPTESYVYGQCLDKFGRMKPKYGSRCTRCRSSEASEVYRPGLLEIMPQRWHALRQWIHFRIFSRCCDCHRPQLVFGKSVGSHPDCIPF